MASVDTRIRALEARSDRFTQDVVVIDEGENPFRLMVQGAESPQEFMRQVAAVRSEAAPGLRAATPAEAEIEPDCLSAWKPA